MSDSLSTSGFYSARPTIKINDQEEPALSDGLVSLLVEETTDGLYRCEATLGNWGSNAGGESGFLFFDGQVLDFGAALSVVAGESDTESTLFQGRVIGIEGRFPGDSPPEVLVLAEDRLQELRMVRRTRTFEEVSDRDVFDQIASAHGLTAELDIDGPTYSVLAQVNQSDLAFLRERARAIDAELWVQGDTLFAQARSRRNQGEITLEYGHALKSFSVLADLANQRTSFAVNGWDVETKEGVSHVADEAAIQNELAGDRSGVALLNDVFGARVESIVHMVPFSTEEAQFYAEAHFKKIARRFVTGEGVADGDGRIKVGAKMELTGVGAPFEGSYYVTEVCHMFEADAGFKTAFKVERPGIKAG